MTREVTEEERELIEKHIPDDLDDHVREMAAQEVLQWIREGAELDDGFDVEEFERRMRRKRRYR